jgi:hypothetical protein
MGTVPAGAFAHDAERFRKRRFGTRLFKTRLFGTRLFRTKLLQETRVSGSAGLGALAVDLGAFEIALPKIIRDFVERALFPLFGFSEPENPAFGIERRALSAEEFLPADFNELVHELHSSVKPISLRTIAES